MNNKIRIIDSTDTEVYVILLQPIYTPEYINSIMDLYDNNRVIYIDMFSLHGDKDTRFWQYSGNGTSLELVTDDEIISKLGVKCNQYISEHREIIENSCHPTFYKYAFNDYLDYNLKFKMTSYKDESEHTSNLTRDIELMKIEGFHLDEFKRIPENNEYVTKFIKEQNIKKESDSSDFDKIISGLTEYADMMIKNIKTEAAKYKKEDQQMFIKGASWMFHFMNKILAQ